MSFVLRGILCCWMFLCVASVAAAQDRVALAIGNSAYAHVPSLLNPTNDAHDIGAALTRIGFDTDVHLDLTWAETRQVLRDFARKADGAEMAVLYFAGHGVELDNRNYLLPVDANIESARDVPYASTELEQLLRAVEGARDLKLVLLDACRNNPFASLMANGTRSLGRGLAGIDPPGGVVVGYAARGGTVAYDGTGRNSPYAEAILAHIEAPGLEIGRFFRSVRDRVFVQTEGQQEPFTYGSLPARDIFLKSPPPQADVLNDFVQASLENSVAGWRAFLRQHGASGREQALLDRAQQALVALGGEVDFTVLRSEPYLANPTDKSGVAVAMAVIEQPLISACDRLAGDPGDPDLPEDIAPIERDALELAAAESACRVAIAGHPDHGRSHYQLGRVLWAVGEEAQAMDAYRKAAKAGYATAQMRYGTLALERAEAETDAIAYLEAAAAAGRAGAALRLAEHYAATPSPQARAKALQFFLQGAALGSDEAMLAAGQRLLVQHPLTEDARREGVYWLTRAADQGNAGAMVRLGDYFLADPVSEDGLQAVGWFEAGAAMGARDAMRRLTDVYRRGGAGIVPDGAGWRQWAVALAQAGDPVGMLEAGYIMERGIGGPRSPSQAAEWYFAALQAGDDGILRRAVDDWDAQTARTFQALLKAQRRSQFKGPLDGHIGSSTRAEMRRLCQCTPSGDRQAFAERFASAASQ